MNENIRKQLLRAAILAPSADNQVPYTIVWSADEDSLLMRLNLERCGQATDKLFTLTDLAVGTSLESLSLAALSLGYKAEVNLFPNGNEDKFTVAKIQFSPLEPSLQPDQAELSLGKQIPLRCTDRRFPYAGEVSDKKLIDIQSSISHSQYKLHSFNTRQTIAPLIPVIYQAERTRFESPLLHKELFDAIVFTRKFTPRGMNLNVVGVKWFETMGFYCLSKWKILKVLNLLGVSRLLAHKSVTQAIKKSPALLLLSVPLNSLNSRSGIIEAGRQMQRVWLKCTESGLSVQVYAAPGVLSLVKPAIGQRLLKVLDSVERNLAKITGKDRHGLIFFRIGEMAEKPERSGRCSEESIQ